MTEKTTPMIYAFGLAGGATLKQMLHVAAGDAEIGARELRKAAGSLRSEDVLHEGGGATGSVQGVPLLRLEDALSALRLSVRLLEAIVTVNKAAADLERFRVEMGAASLDELLGNRAPDSST